MKTILRTGVLTLLLVWSLPLLAVGREPSSDRVQQLYEEAKLQEKAGHPDIAIQKYQELIKLSPDLPAAYNNLGRLYYQQGQFDEAVKTLRRATQLDPKLEPPRVLLGLVFFQLEDFEAARRELKAASQLNPADANARLFLARSLVELNDLGGALRILEQLQREDPKNTEVLYSLGDVYTSLAQITIGQIQTVDPKSYLLELVLGKVSEIKQVYADAAEHYKRAIERAPDVPDLYYRYAHALWAASDADGALKAYNTAIDRNPYDYRSEWESARLLLTDDPQEALRRADHALELRPNLPEALTIRGRALLALEKPAEAIAAFKKAIAIDPEDSATHFQLARAYRLTGQQQEAQNENVIYERLEREAHSAKEQKHPSP